MLLSVVLLYSLAVSACQTSPVYQLYHVKPVNHNNETHYCRYPCFDLSEYATNWSIGSNSKLLFLKGTHVLNKAINIINVTNISITGQNNMHVIIKCSNNGGHLFIQGSQSLQIQHIKFVECGINKRLKFYYNHLTPAVAFVHCTNVQVKFVDFENSFGSSLAIINTGNFTILQQISFYHTKLLDNFNVAHSGLTIEFTALYQSAIIFINNCSFLNFDGMMRDREAALLLDGGTAVTIISRCRQLPLPTIQINIEHCKFLNNTLSVGPLIKIDISIGYINISFTDIVITENRRRGILPLNQIKFSIPLVELSSQVCAFNVTEEPAPQWITFKNSLISFNHFTRSIFECVQLSNSFVHLLIHSSVFSFNEVLMSFMMLIHLATLSINNTMFISNSACISDSMHTSDKETCCFLTSNADIKLFSGRIEFTENYVEKSHYFWIIYGHIFLNENTVLILSLNFPHQLNGGISIIKVINPTIKDRSSLLPCFFQYISSKKNLDEEFNNDAISLNYSIIIQNNSKYDSAILGQNLKDCYWLPSSSFRNVHPGVVSKRFVHFDQGKNPTGADYNGCLCYKGNQTTECLYDEIESVYPGQEIEIGFMLSNIHPDDVKQYYDQVNLFNDNNTIISLHIDGSNFSKVTAEKCSFKRITLHLHQTFYEPYQCSIAHNFFHYYNGLGFHKRIVTFSIYYINVLPCPPGFLLFDGKCICHPIFDHMLINCHIEDQTVYRPATVWMMYSKIKRDIEYADDCPFHYCLSSSIYIQLTDPDKQCNPNRKGILCGQCSVGYSAVFGSTRCKRCSNGWLASIGIFSAVIVATLLLFIPVVDKIDVDLKGVNISGFALYINILNANRLNICTPINDHSSFAFVLVSLLNFDLGFEMCFYNGMTEYAKLWLQLAFPVSLVCTLCLLMKCLKGTRSRNVKYILTLFLLTLYNKILQALCKEFFFYKKLHHLESGKTEYLWSVYPSIPLFSPLHLPYFILCLIATVMVIVINVVTLFPQVFGETCNSYLLFPSSVQSILKQKHKYWLGVELFLRVVIVVLTALKPQLSLLLNTVVLIAFVCCLGFISPFKDIKNTILESVFTTSLIFIFMISLYYETELYCVVTNVTVILSLAAYIVMLAYPSRVLPWRYIYQCFHTICTSICKNIRCE